MLVPVMWSVWGVLALITAVLYLYRSTLTRDEEDQVFLDDAFEQERAVQAGIVARVQKIEPALHAVLWATGAVSVVIVAYYVVDIIRHIM